MGGGVSCIWMLGMVMQWAIGKPDAWQLLDSHLVSPLQGLKVYLCRSLLPPALRGYYTDDFDVTREGGCPQNTLFGSYQYRQIQSDGRR